MNVCRAHRTAAMGSGRLIPKEMIVQNPMPTIGHNPTIWVKLEAGERYAGKSDLMNRTNEQNSAMNVGTALDNPSIKKTAWVEVAVNRMVRASPLDLNTSRKSEINPMRQSPAAGILIHPTIGIILSSNTPLRKKRINDPNSKLGVSILSTTIFNIILRPLYLYTFA